MPPLHSIPQNLHTEEVPIKQSIDNFNDHQMVTRAKVGVFKPKVYIATLEPTSMKKSLQDPKWLDAMKEEFNALIKNHMWTPERTTIGSK